MNITVEPMSVRKSRLVMFMHSGLHMIKGMLMQDVFGR